MQQVTFCARVLALVLALMAFCRLSAASAEPWVMVDTTRQTLTVRDGDTVLDTFTGIALGRSGAGIKKRRGDDVTPVGEFRVGWITGRSQFTLFIGLNYPNLEHASRALGDKRIDEPTYYAIRSALESGRTPPQHTPLGGLIGIHGLGAGDPRIHADFNWTNGCIALSNAQIRRLAGWVRVGTRVVIR